MLKNITVYNHIYFTVGYTRISVIDFALKKIYFISKDYFDFLQKLYSGKQINITKDEIEVLEYFKQKNLVYESDEPVGVSIPISIPKYNKPNDIDSCIIPLSVFIKTDNFLNLVENLSISTMYIKFDDTKHISKALNKINNSSLNSVEIEIEDGQFSNMELDVLLNDNPRIFKVHIKNCKENKLSTTLVNNKTVQLFFYKKKNKKVNLVEILINENIFIESQRFNVFHNKKLVVDHEGNINTNSYSFSIFNLKHSSELKEIINKYENLYSLSKNKIEICCDCEFKGICVDKRNILLRKETNSYYYEKECSYNPYIAKWEGEKGYKNLKKCGVISNKKKFSINHEKIMEINHKLLS